MIKKINLLTKIFLKDYYQNLNIINKKNNKLNGKSAFTWLLILAICAISFFSLQAIKFAKNIGVPILFLKIYLPIISSIMIVQLITLICRIFYYSKDLEYIMPLPIKIKELLIAKLNTVIIVMYFMEALYLLIPLFMYGILLAKGLLFFALAILVLIIFPILFSTIISIIMLLIMKLSKFFKNQDIFQLALVFILTFIIGCIETVYIERVMMSNNQNGLTQLQSIEMKVDEINKIFLITNPTIKILENNNLIFNIIKIIIINSIAFFIFILLGKKLYLKNILQNKNSEKNLKIKNKKIYKYKCKNKKIEYIKKEIKKIIKSPAFFMQYIMQYLWLVIVCVILLQVFIPVYIDQIIQSKMIENMPINDFKLQSTLIVIGLLQLIFTFSNLSITAISREGKNAVFMKYIPIPLYNQFKMKTIPQIFINTIVILVILNTIYIKVPEITLGYCFIAFIISMIINVLNSYIMLLIDAKNPNLNWTNEESISKNNQNKLYQYVFSIIMCLILSYLASILEGCKFIISVVIIIVILLIVIILLNKYIKKNINKIFKKIY